MSDLGNKEIMAKNITYYMKKNNKTRREMSEALNVAYTTFTDWVKGKAYPRIDKIEMMANYFGIEKSDLVEDKTKSKTVIPVLGYIAAGVPIHASEEIIDYEEIPEKLANTGELFGLRIKGHSMEPRLCDGDVVIVRQQDHIQNGELAIVIINGDEGTCKKVMINNDGITLISFNPAYPDMVFSAKEVQDLPIKICGKVIKAILNF